jgi:hypothetical protein
LGPASGLVLESRGQQPCNPFIHLLGENWIGMYWNPDILPRAPDMIGQTERHRWCAWRATLPQALVWHHKVGETDHEPDLPPVAEAAPGQTPGTASQGRDQAAQGAIPAFHQRGLDRLPELPEPQLLTKTARPPEDHTPADLHHLARLVAHLDHLGVEQVFWCDESGLRRATDCPPPAGTIDDAHDLEQRRGIRLPAIGPKLPGGFGRN